MEQDLDIIRDDLNSASNIISDYVNSYYQEDIEKNLKFILIINIFEKVIQDFFNIKNNYLIDIKTLDIIEHLLSNELTKIFSIILKEKEKQNGVKVCDLLSYELIPIVNSLKSILSNVSF